MQSDKMEYAVNGKELQMERIGMALLFFVGWVLTLNSGNAIFDDLQVYFDTGVFDINPVHWLGSLWMAIVVYVFVYRTKIKYGEKTNVDSYNEVMTQQVRLNGILEDFLSGIPDPLYEASDDEIQMLRLVGIIGGHKDFIREGHELRMAMLHATPSAMKVFK